MTFLIRWGVRLAALFTLVFVVGACLATKALLTPPKVARIYDDESLRVAYPLASANVTGRLKAFLDTFPQQTIFTLDVSEMEANAVLVGSMEKNGVPLEGSRLFLGEDQVTLVLKVLPATLQAKSENPRLRDLRLPWPLEVFRNTPFTFMLRMNARMDPATRQFTFSKTEILAGRLNAGTAPELLWRTPVGRYLIQTMALSLGMDDPVVMQLSELEPTLDFTTKVLEQNLNQYMKKMEEDGVFVLDQFDLGEKRLTFVLKAGWRVEEALDEVVKMQRDPYYYSTVQQKLLKGDLTPQECELGRQIIADKEALESTALSPEEEEAIQEMKKWVNDPACGQKKHHALPSPGQ